MVAEAVKGASDSAVAVTEEQCQLASAVDPGRA